METAMRTENVDRLAGSLLLIGALAVFVTGAAIGFLAPSLNDAPPFVTDDIARVAAAISGNPTAWRWATGLILAAAILTALGLVPLSFRFRGRSRTWAFMALGAFVFAAMFESIDGLISMEVTTWAAQQYPDATVFAVWEGFERLRFGTAFYILAFIALGLYGFAIVQTQRTLALGWSFVTASGLAIALEVIAGVGIPGFVYLGTAALGVVTWQLDLVPESEA